MTSNDDQAPMTPLPPQLAGHYASLSDEALLAECENEFFVASGPGGQHRNKTSTAVRLRHLPTGLVVMATEHRSQLVNRNTALERLRAKFKALSFVPKPRKETKPSRSAKRRRVEDKRRQSEKKTGRRGGWD